MFLDRYSKVAKQILILIALTALLAQPAFAGPGGVALDDGFFRAINNGNKGCGFVEDKWTPGKLKNGLFKKLKKKKLKGKKGKALKKFCKGLANIPPGTEVASLSQIPNMSNLVSDGKKKKKKKKKKKNNLEVDFASSTAPTQKQLLNKKPSNVYWREGFFPLTAQKVSNNPELCEELWAGDEPGESSGYGGKHMGDSLAQSFKSFAQAGVSSCYMKEISNPDLLGKGVTITSGAVEDPRTMFSPGETDRFYRIDVVGEEDRGGDEEGEHEGEGDHGGGGDGPIIIKAFAEGDHIFKVALAFCPEEGSTPTGYHLIEVNEDGDGQEVFQFTSAEQFGENDKFSSSVSGPLKLNADGTRSFQGGIAEVQYQGEDGGPDAEEGVDLNFKARISVEPAEGGEKGRIDLKLYDLVSGDFSINRKVSLIYNFAGATLPELQMLRAAFSVVEERSEEQGGNSSFNGTAAWNNAAQRYLVDRDSSLADQLTSPANDSYFDTAPTAVTIDTSDFTCTPDSLVATIEVDMSAPKMRAVGRKCEKDFIQDGNSRDDEALARAENICRQGGEGGGDEGGEGEGGGDEGGEGGGEE